MNPQPRFFLLLTAALALPLVGCGGPSDDTRTLRGPAVALGDGTARTYVRLDADGQPASTGFVVSAEALDAFRTGFAGHDAPYPVYYDGKRDEYRIELGALAPPQASRRSR